MLTLVNLTRLIMNHYQFTFGRQSNTFNISCHNLHKNIFADMYKNYVMCHHTSTQYDM
jgi:hypothetical protein